jgi:hypothetical protein
MKRLPSSSIFVIILPAAICLYLYAAHFQTAGFFHDDGIYMVNAKSIYEGTGYSIASLPNSPPQTKYPPVLSLILSLCWHINPSFPQNIILMRLFSALCAVLTLFMAWLYIRQKSNYTILPVFLFLSALAFNPYFALFSGQVMSEMPFTLFSLASIALFIHYERYGKKSSLYGSLLLATIAFYTRTIGIAMFVSFFLWFLYQRRFKASLGALAVMVFATMPWFYWVLSNDPATNSLVTTYYRSYSSWFILAAQASSSWFIPNIQGFALPGLICPFIEVQSITLKSILSIIFTFFVWFFLIKGIIYRLRKSPSIDTFYLIVTMVIVAIWSVSMDAARFLFPLLPIVLFHIIEGVKAVREDVISLSFRYQNLARRFWQLAVAVLVVGIFVVAIPQTNRLLRTTFCNSEALFHLVEEASDWISHNTERKDVIASHLDPLVYLLSARHAVNVACINPFAICQSHGNTSDNAYDDDDILGAIENYRVSYLLMVYPIRWRLEDELRNKKLAEIIRKYPDAFHKCYEEKLFAVYRVERQYLVDEGNFRGAPHDF